MERLSIRIENDHNSATLLSKSIAAGTTSFHIPSPGMTTIRYVFMYVASFNNCIEKDCKQTQFYL